MRLVYIANARIPSEKANTYQTLKMCEAFADQGIEVELVYPRLHNTPEMLQVDSIWDYYGLRNTFRFKRVFSFDDLHWHAVRISGCEYFWLLAMLQNWSFAVSAVLYLWRCHADAYYFRDLFSAMLFALVRPRTGKRVFFEAHNFPSTGLGQRLRLWLYHRIGGVVVITEKLKTYMPPALSRNRIIVARDGVDLGLFENLPVREVARGNLELPLNRAIVTYTGHLYPWKGVYTLADAARLAPDILFVVVGGTTQDGKRFRDHVRASGVRNVRVVGHVPPTEVPLYLSAEDVLVLPNSAREVISREYTSPLKLFEYMASSTPIVASDLPSLREVLQDGENALLVEPDDPEALVGGLRRILQEDDLGSRLAAQARQDAAAYTWKQRASKVLKAVESVQSEVSGL
jgi:glycosyltransferase involved in cell wall biosynthesis